MTDYRKDFKPAVPMGVLFEGTAPEHTADYYDARAATYDVDVAKVAYKGADYAVADLVKNLPDKNALIISVGAGTGHEGQLLHDLGYRNLHAVDGAPKMIDLCRKRNIFSMAQPVLFHVAQKSELPDEHYDALICVGTFYPKCLDARHLPELMRIVKQQGIVLIATQLKVVFPDPAPEVVDYPHALDATIHTMRDNKQIELIERNVYADYGGTLGDDRGVVYVIRKLI